MPCPCPGDLPHSEIEPCIFCITGVNMQVLYHLGFPCGSAGKESACNTGDGGLIPGLGRSPGEGEGYTLQYSGLENSMNCIVHWVSKGRTRLSDFHFFTASATWEALLQHRVLCNEIMRYILLRDKGNLASFSQHSYNFQFTEVEYYFLKYF